MFPLAEEVSPDSRVSIVTDQWWKRVAENVFTIIEWRSDGWKKRRRSKDEL